jgi:hypothetical protein
MDTHDAAGEYLRMAERYRQRSDEEILLLVPQNSELTRQAQEALASEVRQRGLKAEIKSDDEELAPRFPPPKFRFERADEIRNTSDLNLAEENLDDNPVYQEDRELVELCTVWSVRDALKIQTILDNASIPFFMGSEKATSVDNVTSDFAKGVVVQIMRIGRPWVPMQNYFPEDDPTPEPEEPEEILMRCPLCHSTEVVFLDRTGEPPKLETDAPQKFRWTCDSCGNQWEDDGTVKED